MINIQNISRWFGDRPVFEAASATLALDSRSGLIGPNGSGKTTFLKMLCGIEKPDKGTIALPDSFTIGYLPQEMETYDDLTPLQIVLKPFEHLMNYEEKIQEIGEQLATSSDLKKELVSLDKLHDLMQRHDGFSLNSRAEAILAGLGVPKTHWNQPVQTLSGGYRMRNVLGQLLLSEPDFLLLDEPTNHLDMDSLVWLEKYLRDYKGGMLIVSHDRDFLNRITTQTVEIRNTVLNVYKGNYDAYIVARRDAEAVEQARRKNIELQIAHLERFVERFKAKATKATQAQSRMKKIDLLKAELPPEMASGPSLRFSLPVPCVSGEIPFAANGISVSFGAIPVFEKLSFEVRRGEKVAIVGPNGAGKSTLLKVIAGTISPGAGNLRFGSNTIVRYFGQHQLDQLDPSKTLYETVAAQSINTEKTFIRNVLGAFLFSGDAVDKTAGVLSGGEKSRLLLATIMASPGNLLLLDEPTNHLDIQSVETLGDALASYSGTVIFVSHDEFFINRFANRIIELRPGLFRDFPGTLSDYRSYLEYGENSVPVTEHGSDKAIPQANEKSEKVQRIEDRNARKKLSRKIEKLEKEIEEKERCICKYQADLEDPSNGTNFTLLHELSQSLSQEKSALNVLMESWEAANSELDQMLPENA